MNENRKFKPSTVLTHILLIVLVVINLFPLYWMTTFSLKDNDEIFGGYLRDSAGKVILDENGERIPMERNMIGLPHTWRWYNYEKALNTGNMGRYFLNSLIVASSTILLTLIAAFMATYALTRLVWKGRKMMNKFFMLGLTIPIHAALIPVFMILSRL